MQVLGFIGDGLEWFPVSAQRSSASAWPEGARCDASAWKTVNVGPVERAVRIVIGLQAMFGGVLLLAETTSVIGAVLLSPLPLAGVGLLVTDPYGHSPLYRRLGHTPASLHRT